MSFLSPVRVEASGGGEKSDEFSLQKLPSVAFLQPPTVHVCMNVAQGNKGGVGLLYLILLEHFLQPAREEKSL